jgi:hypothetical protein
MTHEALTKERAALLAVKAAFNSSNVCDFSKLREVLPLVNAALSGPPAPTEYILELIGCDARRLNDAERFAYLTDEIRDLVYQQRRKDLVRRLSAMSMADARKAIDTAIRETGWMWREEHLRLLRRDRVAMSAILKRQCQALCRTPNLTAVCTLPKGHDGNEHCAEYCGYTFIEGVDTEASSAP